jgi:phosphohistidine phosphatase SixA
MDHAAVTAWGHGFTARRIVAVGCLGIVAIGCLGILALAGSTGAAPLAAGDRPPAMVVLVRHAEKAAEPEGDPPLTAAGRARAAALAEALDGAGVTAIVTSEALRTRETARPVAEARSLEPVAIGFGQGGLAAHVAAVAAEVRRHPGGVVLVVGHSNTIPLIIAALGGPSLPKIPESEYAHLFVLVPGPDGARLVQSSYGAPDGGARAARR